MTFDSRGRLWVVQYLQYPFPAGLKVVKYDQYLRAVFDKVPAAAAARREGADKITVFEDTDGDGKYDKHKDVITGLNIVTSVAVGPRRHLGAESAVSAVLSRRQRRRRARRRSRGAPERLRPGRHALGRQQPEVGPRRLAVRRQRQHDDRQHQLSDVTKNVAFQGQMIWRYHPDTKVFEIFAEGGGNTFSLEIDTAGRVFSGTNGGGTRGMYYPQGSYGEKNWGKHGPLTNPYAFGFFEHMRHEGDADRFRQTFVIYEGGAFPEQYRPRDHRGQRPAQPRLGQRAACATPRPTARSTCRCLAVTTDRWFRPVDVEGRARRGGVRRRLVRQRG